ncbi:hypothetical protein ACJRO7_018557 [Eucalyptus globulus]|uniref:HMA domain-containing protein n=1 Tax=Eucalyptus globulus TaxID=34317 RepID=A0ABD3KV20_EUCGL
MKKLPRQCLLNYENLTLPPFQVVVMTANVGCARCRESLASHFEDGRAREYTVDIRNERVIVKGDFKVEREIQDESADLQIKKEEEHQLRLFFRYFRTSCLGKYLGH